MRIKSADDRKAWLSERLGDGVARVAKSAGVKECAGCAKRRSWLNRLDVLGVQVAFHLTYPMLPKRWHRGWAAILQRRSPFKR